MGQDTERLWNANYWRVMTANFSLFLAFYLLTPLLPLYLTETFGATKDMVGLVLSGYYGSALLIGLGNGHMWPAFQNMMIGIARNNERGTANSTILTSWDLGQGIGILFGGFIAEYIGYSAAFWWVVVMHVVGVVLFFVVTRKQLRNCHPGSQ